MYNFLKIMSMSHSPHKFDIQFPLLFTSFYLTCYTNFLSYPISSFFAPSIIVPTYYFSDIKCHEAISLRSVSDNKLFNQIKYLSV